MRGYPHDILHHCHRVLKDIPVNLLMNIANPGPTLVISGGVGFIDVADLQGFGMKDFAIDMELFRDLLKLFFLVSHKIVVGGPTEIFSSSHCPRYFCGFVRAAIFGGQRVIWLAMTLQPSSRQCPGLSDKRLRAVAPASHSQP